MGLAQVVCGDGIDRARPLARRWLRYRRSYRLGYRLRYRRCYEWQRMTPSRRAFHECRMQFPRHCVSPRNRIVGIATFADTVESSPNRIACETAPSASCLRSSPRAWTRSFARGLSNPHVGPMACAWVRHLARRPAIAGACPLIRVWVRWYARQHRPRAYLGVGVRVTGLTRTFSGSRASGTPGQAPLCSQRRPPCPRHAIVGVCGRGGLYCGRHIPANSDLTTRGAASPPASGGNCATRGPRA